MVNRKQLLREHFQLLHPLIPNSEFYPNCLSFNRAYLTNARGEAWDGQYTQVFTFDETRDGLSRNWHGELLEMIRFLIEGRGWFWFMGNTSFPAPHERAMWHIAYISDHPIVMPFEDLNGATHAGSKISPGMALLRAYLGRLGVPNIPRIG
jgi:hypothetical protein